MHHLSLCPEGESSISRVVKGCRGFRWRPSRCFELNHMLHRLCGSPSIPLSFNLAVVLPGGVLNALAAALGGNPLTLSTHRLRRGLPGYLILFDPHALAHRQSVTDQKVAFATGVPPYLCAFHRYTWNSTSSSALKFSISNDPPRLSRGLSHQT